MSVPSPFRLEQAMSVLMSVRSRLLEDDPDLADDERLMADMLEGETGDAMEMIDRMVRASLEADALAKAGKERLNTLRDRIARFERRRDAYRGAVFAALDALGLTRIERGDFLATIRGGVPGVQVTDETALPDNFVRVRREPDKALIYAAIRAGETVPGAEMRNGTPSLQVRAS